MLVDLFDPADPVFLADPYPAFARLRAAGPVHHHPGLGPPGSGLHVAVSHAACQAVLRDRGLGRIWQDREPVEVFPAFNLLHRTSLLESEPPTHTRLRRLVAGAFARGHVERLRPWIARVAGRLVAQLAGELADGGADRPADLLRTVAEPMPVEVIAELLGVPESDRPRLRPWSNTIVKMYEYGLDADRQAAAERACADFVGYLRDLIAQRRAAAEGGGAGRDLVTDLVRASDGGDRLSEDEVVGTCALLLMAGHEASVNVVGNGMLALLRDPDQWRRVAADPGLVPACAQEMLRFDSALQLFERTATRDVEIAGTTIPAGSTVAALLGAANRDPAVFPAPDSFDAGRDPNPHVAFGAGIHYCLGAPLAVVEIESVLRELARRLPGLELAGEPRRRAEFVIRGLHDLPVTAPRPA